MVSEDIRKDAIAKALASQPAESETLRVPWRGQMERMPVIRIPLDVVVLNPTSHRIKAQLESASDAQKLIQEDPESEASQHAIADLLRETLGFEPLKQNLEDEGQREPAIVTSQGRLINGNTRAVALRDLGQEHMDVAVLPADASLGEIYDLELDLQVAQDYRQDYSFTNELLFVDDLITEQGRDEEEVAMRLRWASQAKQSSIKKGVARVRRYVRHLSLIRDIQKMSGSQVPLTDFDDAGQALLELDDDYEGMRNKDPSAAERLKSARTLGLLVDLGYLRQRAVNAQWVETYFDEAISEDPILSEVRAAVESNDGDHAKAAQDDDLSAFEDPNGSSVSEGPGHQVVDVLVKRLSRSTGDAKVSLPTPDGEKEFDREEISETLNEAMRAAAEDSQRAAKAGDELRLPVVLTEEATKRLTKARQTLEAVSDRNGFDLDGLVKQIDMATRALDALRQDAGD